MRSALLWTGFFAAGIIAGLVNLAPEILLSDEVTQGTLYVLLLLVGFGLGSDKNALQTLLKIDGRTLLVPGGVVIGSLAGAGLVSLALDQINLREAMAVAAGFGYYSLSSVIIGQIHSEELGAIALLANVCREVSTILLAPLYVRIFNPLAVIASGGATTMDTTLPIVQRFSGKNYLVVAVVNGAVLTLIGPVLVTLLLTW